MNLKIENIAPKDIETRSMEIITTEMGEHNIPQERLDIVKRVIHTSADFDYINSLKFSENAVRNGLEAIKNGCTIVTDTQMAKSGINKKVLSKFGCECVCFMSDEDVAREAKERNVTRAIISMERAAKIEGDIILALGNAPTALIKAAELIESGEIKPRLIIGVPVGFVNVVESKEYIMTKKCEYIVAAGRKGGSNVAAAICNALIYKVSKNERE